MKRSKHFVFVPFILFSLLLFVYGCSVTSMKWRIKWDKDKKEGKKEFFADKASGQHKQKPPNIIILLCDDLGRFEVSAYDGVDHISTPNIDQLGAEGVVFEEGYVTAPTCAPSRSGIMTGRVQNRYGFETQIMEHYPTNTIEYLSGKYMVNTGSFVMKARPSFPAEWQIQKQGVPPTEITLAERLKAMGYHTGIVGKRHLGVSNNHLPTKRGFDYQYGIYGAHSLFTPERNWNGIINYEHQSFSAQHQWNMGRYGEAAVREMERKYMKSNTSLLHSGIKQWSSWRKTKMSPFSSIVLLLHPTSPSRHPLIITVCTIMLKMKTNACIMP